MPEFRQRLYIRRKGRMTKGQSKALAEAYGGWCQPVTDTPLDMAAWFGREAPLVLEIGFGMGHALIAQAQARPDWNCLGIEFYLPGIGALLAAAQHQQLPNIRVLDGDARQALMAMLTPASLTQISIFFPDPWPKAKHHKRRLIQPEFVALLSSRLQAGGTLLLATDWEDYAAHMLTVLNAEPSLRNLAPAHGYSERAPVRPLTNFEARGQRLGHEVWDLRFQKLAADGQFHQ